MKHRIEIEGEAGFRRSGVGLSGSGRRLGFSLWPPEKLPVEDFGGREIGRSSLFSGRERAEINLVPAHLYPRSPSSVLRLECNPAISSTIFGWLPIVKVLMNCGRAEIARPIVQAISVNVVDNFRHIEKIEAQGQRKNYPMHKHLCLCHLHALADVSITRLNGACACPRISRVKHLLPRLVREVMSRSDFPDQGPVLLVHPEAFRQV